MKNFNFVQFCKGAMFLMIGLGVALFGFSTLVNNPVKADNPAMTSNVGKYMMSESGFVLNGKAMYHVLVWDSETGKSKLYGFNSSSTTMEATPYKLPSSPLY